MSNKNAKVWSEKMSKEWATYIPPERPSFEELEIYEDYLLKVINKKGKNIKALLLGATPELRDLLAKHKVKTVCVDINPSMVRAMDRLLEISDGKEEVIIADWEEVPLKDEEFDVILGDHSVHWIPFDRWNSFLKDKARLLKEGGSIIFNIVTVQKEELITVEKMVEILKFKKFFSREESMYYQYLALLGLDCDDRGKYVRPVNRYNKELRKFKKTGKINSKEYDIYFVHGRDFLQLCPLEK